MKFKAKLELGGKTATGIQVPEKVVEALGKGKQPPVSVTIKGYTFRNKVFVRDGEYMLPVSAEHREGAGIAAGDTVEVDIELDTAPREVTVPADFAKALEGVPAAKRAFEALSYSRKGWHVLQVEGAKTEETRQRRIEKSVGMLREGKG